MTSSDNASTEAEDRASAVVLYHVMRADEGFEKTAEMIFDVVSESARKYPGRPRALFLDIEGHRLGRKNGPYDHDAFEIMNNYVVGFLSPWLTEIHTPLIRARKTSPQRDDLPDHLLTMVVQDGLEQLQEHAARMGMRIYHADSGRWIGEDRERSMTRENQA